MKSGQPGAHLRAPGRFFSLYGVQASPSRAERASRAAAMGRAESSVRNLGLCQPAFSRSGKPEPSQ